MTDHSANLRSLSSSRERRTSEKLKTSHSNAVATNHTISKRLTRNSVAAAAHSMDEDEDIDDDLLHPSMIGPRGRKKTQEKPGVSRASISSLSTANDYATSSGYSTPATSAVATPAVLPKETKPGPRGRPRSSLTTNVLPPSALNAIQQAKDLRNSEFSLNHVSNKRKRFSSEDEEEDSDDSPDARIARDLQDEEDSLVKDYYSPETNARRSSRPLRMIRPKGGYIDDSEAEPDSEPTKLKERSGSAKRAKISWTDSELSEYATSDSDDILEIPHQDFYRSATKVVAPRRSIKNSAQSRTIPARKQSLDRARNRETSPRGCGTSSVRRSLTQGRSRAVARNIYEDKGETVPAAQADGPSRYSGTALDFSSEISELYTSDSDEGLMTLDNGAPDYLAMANHEEIHATRRATRRAQQDRSKLEFHHPEILTMWNDLKNLPAIKTVPAEQPTNITRQLKPFQLEGLTWMKAMEETEWGGGLLGDEMGMGKTIQAVSLIMSDYPAKNPSLVLIPPVALMQWQQEIGDYTDGTLKTFVFHGTNKVTKGMSVRDLKKYDVILMSYNSLESMYRHQEKGFKRKESVHFQKSVIHQIHFHRVILDEAHNIKTRTTGVAKACFALKADHKWCLSGTPLQNRIGEFFSLIRFLDIRPFACYFCKQCPCKPVEWTMNSENRCTGCSHSGMQHVSVFNQELLNPIQRFGNSGLGKAAFEKLRILTDRFMLRRVKRDHSSAMELPAKEIQVNRQFFGEEENDFAASIMNNGTRKFETYVAQGVLLNNYANIFGLIMQMRQVADHPDLILKKNGEGGQNILVCCICDEPAEEAVRSTCRHDFCRSCARNYLKSSDESDIQHDCPQCHIPLSIDLEQPEIEQDEQLVKKSSIINRIKMENWTSSSKIEALVHDLHSLRSHKSSSKSIIFSQFTTMLQLVEWRLRRAGITTVMLDGSMTPAQRQASINHFMSNVNVECFLVSLKAGGVALNLTEASKVFIVDPWWNPAAEWQSADRCHRIGQCRPCSITRLCIEDSVESRMVLLQEKKANMINSTINADDSAMESLTAEDMQFLFRGN